MDGQTAEKSGLPRESFITLATNDAYAIGALVLGHSLRHVQTSKELTILITEGVPHNYRKILDNIYDNVIVVTQLESNDNENLQLLGRLNLGLTYTKIHCWRLTQFSKAVFLDADTIALQNLDDLFDYDEFSASPDPSWPDIFNSGVFVFKPNNSTFRALMQLAAIKGSFDGGDQGLLNEFFKDWSKVTLKTRLPFAYNCSCWVMPNDAQVFYTRPPAWKKFGNIVKLAHFTGLIKPWTRRMSVNDSAILQAIDMLENCPDVYSAAEQTGVLAYWWAIFFKFIKPNLREGMFLASWDYPIVACSLPPPPIPAPQSWQPPEYPGDAIQQTNFWQQTERFHPEFHDFSFVHMHEGQRTDQTNRYPDYHEFVVHEPTPKMPEHHQLYQKKMQEQQTQNHDDVHKQNHNHSNQPQHESRHPHQDQHKQHEHQHVFHHHQQEEQSRENEFPDSNREEQKPNQQQNIFCMPCQEQHQEQGKDPKHHQESQSAQETVEYIYSEPMHFPHQEKRSSNESQMQQQICTAKPEQDEHRPAPETVFQSCQPRNDKDPLFYAPRLTCCECVKEVKWSKHFMEPITRKLLPDTLPASRSLSLRQKIRTRSVPLGLNENMFLHRLDPAPTNCSAKSSDQFVVPDKEVRGGSRKTTPMTAIQKSKSSRLHQVHRVRLNEQGRKTRPIRLSKEKSTLLKEQTQTKATEAKLVYDTRRAVALDTISPVNEPPTDVQKVFAVKADSGKDTDMEEFIQIKDSLPAFSTISAKESRCNEFDAIDSHFMEKSRKKTFISRTIKTPDPATFGMQEMDPKKLKVGLKYENSTRTKQLLPSLNKSTEIKLSQSLPQITYAETKCLCDRHQPLPPPPAWKMQAWERGDIDYTGSDRFSNILARIRSTIQSNDCTDFPIGTWL